VQHSKIGSRMTATGQLRPGGAKGRSSHVRNAPLATVGAKKAACRNGPTTDVSSRNLMLAQRDGGLQSGAENAKLGRRSLGPLTLRLESDQHRTREA